MDRLRLTEPAPSWRLNCIAVLLAAWLLVGCSTAISGETFQVSPNEAPSGWGGTSARLSLGPNRILFTNGLTATGVGSRASRETDWKAVVHTLTPVGSRWAACGVEPGGGYFGNGSGPLACNLIEADGGLRRINVGRSHVNQGRYDISGSAMLIAAGREVFRFDGDGRITERWLLPQEDSLRQTLIVDGSEVVALALADGGQCRLVRFSLLQGGVVQERKQQAMAGAPCGGYLIARDGVDDALWLASGRHLIRVDRALDLLGFESPIFLDGQVPTGMTAASGRLALWGFGGVVEIYDSRTQTKRLHRVEGADVVGVVPEYGQPESVKIVTYDHSGFFNSRPFDLSKD